MKLKIDLIPKTCWGSNLRNEVKKSDWDKLRKEAYENANMVCEICGDQPKSLDAHEIWEYDEVKHMQKLIKLIAICRSCHNVIHIGRAQQLGFFDDAAKHFMKVNNCGFKEFEKELKEASDNYRRRSKIKQWKLDISFLENRNVVLNNNNIFN